jgi:hypothetical protein
MLSSIVFKFSLLLEKEAKWGEFGLSDIYTRYARKFILKKGGSSKKNDRGSFLKLQERFINDLVYMNSYGKKNCCIKCR